MNNKGFSLVELLAVISLIALVTVLFIKSTSTTLSINDEKTYEIMKNSIRKSATTYILECNSNIYNCNLNWQNNKTTIFAKDLISAGYYKELVNPINNKDLSNCLIITINKDNEVYKATIDDTKC